MAISQNEFLKKISGQTGTIYIARNGSVMVFDIDNGETYMQNCVGGGGVSVNPADQYWCNSIDFSGSFSFYRTWGVVPSGSPRFQAKPLVEISEEQMLKLKTMKGLAQ